MVGRAQKKGLVKICIHNLRDWAVDRRGTMDNKPYGGGVGMVMRPEPVFFALKGVKGEVDFKNQVSVLLTPQGERLRQKKVEKLAKLDRIILFCGHYEGIDERARAYFDQQISVGDYVLSGGETAAMVVADAVIRLVPGVLGKAKSTDEESHSQFTVEGKKTRLLEYPQYTLPRDFRGKKVPEVLLSGNHKKIQAWRMKKLRRPEKT